VPLSVDAARSSDLISCVEANSGQSAWNFNSSRATDAEPQMRIA
jgi:hypothetical protein